MRARSALESENTGYPSTGLNNVASRAAALQPGFRTRRSSPFATKLESLPTRRRVVLDLVKWRQLI
jgi:hypothetical protein